MPLGVQTHTASRSTLESNSSRPVHEEHWYSSASSSASSGTTSATATSSALWRPAMARAWWGPMTPHPSIPKRSLSKDLSSISAVQHVSTLQPSACQLVSLSARDLVEDCGVFYVGVLG